MGGILPTVGGACFTYDSNIFFIGGVDQRGNDKGEELIKGAKISKEIYLI